jgi:glucose dehydrogenase
MKWYYQVVPGDSWDLRQRAAVDLADVTINRPPRKVIMQANKNGFYYMLDRLTGAFISGQPFTTVNWATASTSKPAGRSCGRMRTTEPPSP